MAFVIEVFVRKIFCWRAATSMATEFVVDVLNQAICQRATSEADNLIHKSDRGSQYLSFKYSECLAKVGINPSMGSVGDNGGNVLAESTIGLFKAETLDFMGARKPVGKVERDPEMGDPVQHQTPPFENPPHCSARS